MRGPTGDREEEALGVSKLCEQLLWGNQGNGREGRVSIRASLLARTESKPE